MIPSPKEIGLPAKFNSFRPFQIEALERILASNKRWILLQAPTGTGKTLIAAAWQKIARQSMLYTCTTKDLQDQFTRDFPYAVELKGRENYPTPFSPKISTALCTKTKKDPRCKWCCPPSCYREAPCLATGYCTGQRNCPYDMQKKAALAAPLAVLNTALFLNEANHVGGFSKNKRVIVFDEADLLESSLMSFVEVTISGAMIQRLGLTPPAKKTVEEAWIEWIDQEAIPKIQKRLDELESGDDKWQTTNIKEIRERNDLTRALAKLQFFRAEVEHSPWANCTEDVENGPWVWKPIYVSKFAEKYLWRHADRFLLMSGTILSRDQFCRNLGIPIDQTEYIDLPSVFDKKNRPVYFVPAANMTHKTADGERPKLLEAIDTVLDLHPDEKVLVHTVSYSLSRYIYEHSQHRTRMVTYLDSGTRKETLEEYRRSPRPLVILAPSLERGIDLPDDLCRVIIVAKTPYRSLEDNQVRKRLYGSPDGRAWYAVDAIRTVIQMSGRGIRHERDWAQTYILDAQFGRLYKEWKYVFPAWWRDALQTLSIAQLAEGGGRRNQEYVQPLG